MNRALAAERPKYLTLVPRDEHDARIAEAVEALDQRLGEPRSPVVSPLQVGETRKFIDPYREGRISWVHRLVGGEEIIVIIPMRADAVEVAEKVTELVDTALAQLEP